LQKILEKNVGKTDWKMADKRLEIETLLSRIIEFGYEKFTNRFTKNSERLKWGRLLTVCAKVQNEVLKDLELAELSERVQDIERRLEVRGNE
jgi:hypothetical protein